MKKKVVSRPKAKGGNRKYIFGGIALLFLAFGFTYHDPGSRAVLGASIYRPLFVKSTVTWASMKGASGYDIYYKQTNESTFTNSVINVPSNTSSYTIENLKRGINYQYQVSAIVKGKDIPVTGQLLMTNFQDM